MGKEGGAGGAFAVRTARDGGTGVEGETTRPDANRQYPRRISPKGLADL